MGDAISTASKYVGPLALYHTIKGDDPTQDGGYNPSSLLGLPTLNSLLQGSNQQALPAAPGPAPDLTDAAVQAARRAAARSIGAKQGLQSTFLSGTAKPGTSFLGGGF